MLALMSITPGPSPSPHGELDASQQALGHREVGPRADVRDDDDAQYVRDDEDDEDLRTGWEDFASSAREWSNVALRGGA